MESTLVHLFVFCTFCLTQELYPFMTVLVQGHFLFTEFVYLKSLEDKQSHPFAEKKKEKEKEKNVTFTTKPPHQL